MKRLLLLCLCLSGVFAFVLPVKSSHADVAAAPPPAADSEGFVPDRRPANMANVEEGLPAGPLVAAAYGFIWVAALIFVGLTAQRASQLETEMAQLAERLRWSLEAAQAELPIKPRRPPRAPVCCSVAQADHESMADSGAALVDLLQLSLRAGGRQKQSTGPRPKHRIQLR